MIKKYNQNLLKNFRRKADYTKNKLNYYLDVGNFYATLRKSDIAKITKVSQRTVNRWLKGDQQAPESALELIRLHAFGEPPSMTDDWKGWRFVRGELINSDWDYNFTPYDLKAIIYWQPMCAKFMGENEALRNRLERDEAIETDAKAIVKPYLRLLHF